ncbi:MAG TPA: methylated-DNA--[protein]-cysteine S-methyltransferase [Bryobacteraceae bacterium]|jgi:methylated-DNA-[protein]-cysteine S-methyltransferase|nr:methylated-DNA--[protein]-cysteine S-methyltransferase [Bryobacteraceae bacterium]
MILSYHTYPSPMGDILLVSRGEQLVALDFADYEKRLRRLLDLRHTPYMLKDFPVPRTIADPLDRYFAGDVNALDSLAVDTGGTSFQQRVWAELRRTMPGLTTTYGEIARRIDRPGASRAVGAANGSNAIAIVIPCHRVVGSNGKLTGYAGGLDRKRWLLDHERNNNS